MKAHRFVDAEGRVHVRSLRHIPGSCQHVDMFGRHRAAEYSDRSALRSQQAEEEADSRRLPGAVRTEEAIERSGGHLHAEVRYLKSAPGPIPQVASFDCEGHYSFLPFSS